MLIVDNVIEDVVFFFNLKATFGIDFLCVRQAKNDQLKLVMEVDSE